MTIEFHLFSSHDASLKIFGKAEIVGREVRGVKKYEDTDKFMRSFQFQDPPPANLSGKYQVQFARPYSTLIIIQNENRSWTFRIKPNLWQKIYLWYHSASGLIFTRDIILMLLGAIISALAGAVLA